MDRMAARAGGGKRIGPRAEEIRIDEMVKAAKIYALIALDICSRERPKS